jgi:hypothetical protein
MLLRETVAVYCENHTEHTNTVWVGKTQVCLMLKQLVYVITAVP